MDTTKLVSRMRGNGSIGIAIGAAVSLGVIVGYIIAERKYTKAFDVAVAKEVAATKAFYASQEKLKDKEYASPQAALEALRASNKEVVKVMEETYGVDQYLDDVEKTMDGIENVLDRMEYIPPPDDGNPEGLSEPLPLTEISHNVFTDAPDVEEFNLEEEILKRDPSKPYILEYKEFFESDFINSTLTYFEGDGVLSDDKDQNIPDIEEVVGEDNLLKFGFGSQDNNVVYIRNEKLEIDFEIVRDEGKYTEKILGFIQHEDNPHSRKNKKFKADYE